MAHQIQVQYTVEDGRAATALEQMHSLQAGKSVQGVTVIDVYTIDAKLSRAELKKVADALYTPLFQTVGINRALYPEQFAYAVEIGFLPGVTDNVGTTARETIRDTLKRDLAENEHVYYSQLYFLDGDINKKDAEAIAGSLYNSLIQRAAVKSAAQFKKDKGMGVVLPKVTLEPGSVTSVDLYVDDEELAVLGKQGILDPDTGERRGPLGLSLEDLKAIRNYFHKEKRLPTDAEIEALAQTWSEHCKHTIFSDPLDEITEGIYRRYIKQATAEVRRKKGKNDFCVSVFSDNSGIIEFDRDTYITHKVETHNSPSLLDPFGGAITGIVGVNRDTIGTGLGAKPLLNMYGYCFADPADTTRLFRDKDRTVEILSARRIMDGVIEGVNAGGNQSGIPTPQGFTYFDHRFRGKPLVFVGTVGVMPKKVNGRPSYEKGAEPGDYIVMLGGRVGLDGIHGATFSSEALDSGSPATAVQIGDPITQKKFSDALVKEARDRGLHNSITDNGAGGLSSSVGEMAQESGGCEVWLEQVPLKYPGLSPWQIWVSESQERMTLAVPKKNWDAFRKLMEARGVEASVIGEFTDSGRCVVKHDDETVVDLAMEFMHGGKPIRVQQTKAVSPTASTPPASVLRRYEKDLETTLLDLLKHPNIAGTEFISSQYDHEVQGVSVVKPLQGKGRVNGTASVSRPHTATKKGIVLSQGLCPRYSDLDTYWMAASAIDQAIRNVVAIGGNPSSIALLDNFCWCSSDEPERLYQLKRAAKACYEYAVAFEAPYISGKDSMFNDFKGFDANGKPLTISVPPTLLISSIAVMPDVRKAVTLDVKQPGHLLYLLGETKAELGGSEYMAYLSEKEMKKEKKRYTGEEVPTVDAERNTELYRAYHRALERGLVASAVALERGGLAVGAFKSAIGGQLGISIDIKRVGGSKLGVTEKLFSESNGRLLVSVVPEDRTAFEQALKGNKVARIGTVTDTGDIRITNGSDEVAVTTVADATDAYRAKFSNF